MQGCIYGGSKISGGGGGSECPKYSPCMCVFCTYMYVCGIIGCICNSCEITFTVACTVVGLLSMEAVNSCLCQVADNGYWLEYFHSAQQYHYSLE